MTELQQGKCERAARGLLWALGTTAVGVAAGWLGVALAAIAGLMLVMGDDAQ